VRVDAPLGRSDEVTSPCRSGSGARGGSGRRLTRMALVLPAACAYHRHAISDRTGLMARRLAAILAADVVGYSRLMAADEKGTHARLKALRQDFIEPKIAKHHGRVAKLMGDGALVEFGSVVDAVECVLRRFRAVSPNVRPTCLRTGASRSGSASTSAT
jgi:class 3 adenylate cyclase